ncbi:hypothetical protein ALT721_2320069 [Alteromonas alvinellae]
MNNILEQGSPKISVLLPVYNGEKYLRESLKSILNQTFNDFELIVIDDGSKDSSLEIIKSFEDKRIRLIKNQENLGLIATLNKGLELARGDFIARVDSDDICLPERFEQQSCYLDNNPDVGVIGSYSQLIDENGQNLGIYKVPEAHDDIVMGMVFTNQIIHPSVLMRKSLLTDYFPDVYDGKYLHCEDYALWVSLAKKTKLANLSIPLLKYRVHAESISQINSLEQFKTSEQLKSELSAFLNVNPNVSLISRLISREYRKSVDFAEYYEHVFSNLNDKFFTSDFISKIFWETALRARISGEKSFLIYMRSPYNKNLFKIMVLVFSPLIARLPSSFFKKRMRIFNEQ